MRVGIFAGSFDPVHHGHIDIATSACGQARLNAVYFLVEPQPWADKQPVSVKHRRAMVECALENQPGLRQLEIDGERFTIEHTLPQLKQTFPNDEVVFIFGSDVVMRMNGAQWPGLEELLKHELVLFRRNGDTLEDIQGHLDSIGARATVLDPSQYQCSSSRIRTQIMVGQKVEGCLVSEVADYIRVHDLYSS